MDKMERTAAGMFLALLVSAGAAGSELYTIALSAQTLSGATTNTVIADIYNGAQPGNFGWLTWTGSPSVPALVASLTPPGNSRSYINPDSPDDHTVSVGDWISGKPGVSNSKNVRNALDILTSQDIVVPVWDQARGQGANAAYRVSGFARVRLLSYRLPGQNRITARFLGFVFCGGQNQAPVVNAGGDQSATFPCPASLQGSVTDDGLPQPAMVTQYWSVVSGPGSVVFANSNAPITTATFGAPGVYTLRLTANDSELANYDDAVVTVNMPNRPPTAFPQQVAVPEDTALAITLSGNDPEADPLSFLVTVQPNHGSLTGAPPQLVYQPLADYNGPDLFSFKANDGQLDSSNATVNITVTPVNDPPVADSLTVTNVEDAAVQVAMSGADVDGDALSFVIVGNPGFHTLGTVSSNTVDCTPVHNFNGSDTFKYVTYDGLLYSATATVSLVTLAVNDAPTAAAQAVTAEEDTPAAITLAGSDPEGEALTFQIASAPAHGSLAGAAPNLTYTPAADYAGPDSFTFTATDASGAVSAPATVSITVTPVNDAPRVNAGPDIMLTALGSVALQGTVTDDGLPENGKLTTRWQVVAGSAAAVSFDDAARTTATATFTAPGDYTLRLTALDGAAAAHDELTVSIRLPNEAPAVEAGADFEVTVGTLATLNGSVTDDNQPEGGALVAQWSVISGAPEAVAFDNGGDPAAAARFTAVGVFTLRLTASDGDLTASDTVSVTVVPVPNLPPTVHAGPPQEIALYAACRLLGGAEDDGLPEPGALSLLWEQTAGPGAAVISDVSQARPAVSFPAAGVYSFRLTASDGDLSASADTSVFVSLANQPPQVNAGEDFEMDAGLLALLRGQVNDDGLPLNAVPCSQ